MAHKKSFPSPTFFCNLNTNYYIDEFGIALPIATAVVAYFFWRKRKELPERDTEDTLLSA